MTPCRTSGRSRCGSMLCSGGPEAAGRRPRPLRKSLGGAMTEIQRSLAEEVAEDLADGIITRREAIRRLGLLGLTGAAATGLLTTLATTETAAAGSLTAPG